MNLKFSELASLVPAGTQIINANENAFVCGFAIDTRTLKPGEIFVAIKTEKRDGHDFVPAAIAAGATAILVERELKNVPANIAQIVVPAGKNSEWLLREIATNYRKTCLKNVTIIGVTGSVGKTSTKDMLAHLLAGTHTVFATPKNLNNTLGVPLNICRIDPQKHAFAVIEMGTNSKGEIATCAAVAQPNLAIITNVLPVHLEGLGSMNGIANEKSAIAAAPDCCAVFYSGLLKYDAFKKLAARGNAVVVDSEKLVPESVRALNSTSAGQFENAVLALNVARKFVNNEAVLRERFASWRPSENRGELRALPNGFKAFVDCYNASPFSMLDSVDAFRKALGGNDKNPRLFVLGGMGELGADSENLHRAVGEKLQLDSAHDTLALFGGNAYLIGEGAAGTGFPRERIFVFETIEALRDFVAKFRGNVMLKGSRAFALERAL